MLVRTKDVLANRTLARRKPMSWFPVDHAKDAFAATYPFHPTLLSVFERKWQALPRFQQTRGILRLLALWVSHAYRAGFEGAHRDPRSLGREPHRSTTRCSDRQSSSSSPRKARGRGNDGYLWQEGLPCPPPRQGGRRYDTQGALNATTRADVSRATPEVQSLRSVKNAPLLLRPDRRLGPLSRLQIGRR